MYKILKKIINQWDPLDLLKINCPDDEYETEIDLIWKAIDENISEKQLAEIIYKVFFEMFGDLFKCSKKECLRISKKILQHNTKG